MGIYLSSKYQLVRNKNFTYTYVYLLKFYLKISPQNKFSKNVLKFLTLKYNYHSCLRTVIKNDRGQILADLKSHNDEFLIACGGSGGYGNAQLLSAETPTPQETLPAEIGEEVMAELELRILADYGIVGLPNSGKSSMIRYLTNATPDVSGQVHF